MAQLTTEIQDKLVSLLISEGLVSKNVLDETKQNSIKTNKPLLGMLTEQGIVDDELLTPGSAEITAECIASQTAPKVSGR